MSEANKRKRRAGTREEREEAKEGAKGVKRTDPTVEDDGLVGAGQQRLDT